VIAGSALAVALFARAVRVDNRYIGRIERLDEPRAVHPVETERLAA
jgi:hypothetical protein